MRCSLKPRKLHTNVSQLHSLSSYDSLEDHVPSSKECFPVIPTINILAPQQQPPGKNTMAFDDPVVWVLIIAVVIFLFGSSKIPQLARSLGQARKEFESGWKGISNEIMTAPGTPGTPQTVPLAPRPQPVVPQATPVVTASARPSQTSDPLLLACKNEGIDTAGKTREQLASELAWKLGKK